MNYFNIAKLNRKLETGNGKKNLWQVSWMFRNGYLTEFYEILSLFFEAYLEPSQTFTIELTAKRVNGF